MLFAPKEAEFELDSLETEQVVIEAHKDWLVDLALHEEGLGQELFMIVYVFVDVDSKGSLLGGKHFEVSEGEVVIL
mgnify:CR=1 FL=1